jgi:hypothetical protein
MALSERSKNSLIISSSVKISSLPAVLREALVFSLYKTERFSFCFFSGKIILDFFVPPQSGAFFIIRRFIGTVTEKVRIRVSLLNFGGGYITIYKKAAVR